MKNLEQIAKRLKAKQKEDMFGFETSEYLRFLPYEMAKDYLKPEITATEWNPDSLDKLREIMLDYMPFAWKKANDCRGISANRSVMHYQAWLWIDEQGEWATNLMNEYEFYGKPQLVQICEYLGLDHKKWDDGIRSNTEY